MSGFSGQGKVLIGPRLASGHAGLLSWIGNASVCKAVINEDASVRNESFSGLRLPHRRLSKARSGTLQITFDEFNAANLELAGIATVTTVAPGSPVTGYALPTGAKVGSILATPGVKNLSALAIKDSAGSPATLVSGVDYIPNLKGGSAELLNLGSYVQPFKLDYTGGGFTRVAFLNKQTPELYVKFEGVNTDDGTPLNADIFRVRFKPFKDFDLITEDLKDFELEGEILADLTRQANSSTGMFMTVDTF